MRPIRGHSWSFVFIPASIRVEKEPTARGKIAAEPKGQSPKVRGQRSEVCSSVVLRSAFVVRASARPELPCSCGTGPTLLHSNKATFPALSSLRLALCSLPLSLSQSPTVSQSSALPSALCSLRPAPCPLRPALRAQLPSTSIPTAAMPARMKSTTSPRLSSPATAPPRLPSSRPAGMPFGPYR